MQTPQINNNQPVPMANEFFVLSRGGVGFSAKSGGAKVDGSGTLYLSTLRMVFVGDRAGCAFDMPLATLGEEKFNQPIFGANNMTGVSPPLDLPEGSPDYKWCIKFNNGGVGTFLPFFFRLLAEMRNRMQQAQAAPAAQVRAHHHAARQPSSVRPRAPTLTCQRRARLQATPVPQAIAQGLVQAAFVDPADPTKFYVSVPANQ